MKNETKYVRDTSAMVELMVRAMLDYIRKELNRHYWNDNNVEMASPFDNTGESYWNNYMTVRAYYWGDDEKEAKKPNFETGHMRIYWYKHSNRGLEIYFEKGYDSYDTIAETLSKCIESIEHDFKR